MDKHSFDERLREKLEGFQPEFNPQAWDDMEALLDYGQPKAWYVRWQKPLLVSALAVMTVLNLFLWLRPFNEEAIQSPAIIQQPADPEVITKTIYQTDTVFVDRYIQVPANTDQRPYLAGNSTTYSQPASNQFQFSTNIYGDPISNTSYYDNSNLYAQNRGNFVGVIESTPFDIYTWSEEYLNDYSIENESKDVATIKRNFKHPARTLRIGLIGGFLVPDPDIGERYLSQRFGLVSEIQLKNNWYFTTGLISHDYTYKLDEVDDNNFQIQDLERYPGYADLSGAPNDIVINNEILQLPLQLRYYKPLNYNWAVFLSGGPNLDILLNQTFTYNYIDIENDALVSRSETTIVDEPRVYLSSLGGALGFEHQFSRHLAAQMNIEYQLGINKIGVEKRSVNSLSLNLGAYYKLK